MTNERALDYGEVRCFYTSASEKTNVSTINKIYLNNDSSKVNNKEMK